MKSICIQAEKLVVAALVLFRSQELFNQECALNKSPTVVIFHLHADNGSKKRVIPGTLKHFYSVTWLKQVNGIGSLLYIKLFLTKTCSSQMKLSGGKCSKSIENSMMKSKHIVLNGRLNIALNGRVDLQIVFRISQHSRFMQLDGAKSFIHGGIRTHDLRIRSPARYPLRYADRR